MRNFNPEKMMEYVRTWHLRKYDITPSFEAITWAYPNNSPKQTQAALGVRPIVPIYNMPDSASTLRRRALSCMQTHKYRQYGKRFYGFKVFVSTIAQIWDDLIAGWRKYPRPYFLEKP